MIGTSAERSIESQAWARLGAFLKRERQLLLSPTQQARFVAEWDDITQQEEALEDALLIGLIGGTGVGKSTFINALAGQVVSGSSDRRPTTDRIVVYRYVHTEIPDDVPGRDFAEPQVLHEHKNLSKIILFDFPDFDSAETAHAEIVRRYLPFLDVLLVVVDNMKYGDRRLYDLLRSLEQAPSNLFLLLNKTDFLDDHYGSRAAVVLREMLTDLQDKLVRYGDVQLAAEQLFAVSSRTVLEMRLENPAAEIAGDFQRVERLLERYHEEKHRRAAKECNIDARKSQVAEDLLATALSDEHRDILSTTGQLVDDWRGALDDALAVISTEVLHDRERGGMRKRRLRRLGTAWGLPLSLVFTLFGELRFARVNAASLDATDMGRRAYQHYRGFFEALRNLQARFQSELGGSSLAATEAPVVPPGHARDSHSVSRVSQELAEVMVPKLRQELPKPAAARRTVAHIPALGVLALALWSLVHPLLASITGNSETGILRALISAVIGALSPVFIITTLLGVLLAYLATAAFIWVREIQQLDTEITAAEGALRQRVREAGDRALGQLDDRVRALRAEFEELQQLLKPRG